MNGAGKKRRRIRDVYVAFWHVAGVGCSHVVEDVAVVVVTVALSFYV